MIGLLLCFDIKGAAVIAMWNRILKDRYFQLCHACKVHAWQLVAPSSERTLIMSIIKRGYSLLTYHHTKIGGGCSGGGGGSGSGKLK